MHVEPPRDGLIRVLVVDDHDLFRVGLASLLGEHPDIEVVAQASGGRSGVRLATELAPEVIVMDVQMPDLDGPEATRLILAQQPAARILALTVASGDAQVTAMLAAGACGFLTKDTAIEGVVMAVRAVAQGATWLSPQAAAVAFDRLRRDVPVAAADEERTEDLSPREREVLRLLARGLDNGEIAAQLGISPRTAKNHVSRLLAKLGQPTRVQAALYAVRHGLD